MPLPYKGNEAYYNDKARKWAADHPGQVRASQRASNRKRYALKKAFVHWLKELPCFDCGNNWLPFVIDFDHRPGEVKRFNIANSLQNHSWETLFEEMRKCDLVCANCHRIRTWKKVQ